MVGGGGGGSARARCVSKRHGKRVCLLLFTVYGLYARYTARGVNQKPKTENRKLNQNVKQPRATTPAWACAWALTLSRGIEMAKTENRESRKRY